MSKLKKTAQRACAFLLSVTLAASGLAASAPLARAGEPNTVWFIENNTSAETRITTLLEGETIQLGNAMPSNYSYQDDTPFEVDGLPSGTTVNDILDGGGGRAITAKIQSTFPDPPIPDFTQKTYTLTPSFRAFLTESSIGSTVQDGDTYLILNATTEPNTDVSITQNSSITFSVKRDQSEINGPLQFNVVSAATGDLTAFNGAGISSGEPDVNGVYKIQLTGTPEHGGALILNLKITGQSEILHADATFTLRFNFVQSNTLQLSVISRQEAVNRIAAEIEANTFFDKYVKLARNDYQHGITTKFDLVHMDRRYNYGKGKGTGFQIDWEWKADDERYQSTLNVVSGGQRTETWPVTIANPPLENVTGKLLATVKYVNETGTSTIMIPSKQVKIPITIIGTGTMPYAQPLEAHYGEYNQATGRPNVIVRPITDMPKELDVYDGSKPGFTTEKPFEFTFALHFGTGRGSATRIQINNTFTQSTRGEVDIYLDNSTSKYVQGTDIPNPSADGADIPVNVKVRAAAKGSVALTIIYYNAQGDVFNSPVRYNIGVSNTSPSSDATMKSIGVVASPVATETDKNKEHFNEVYPNGRVDFGFKPEQGDYAIQLPWIADTVDITPFYNQYVKEHQIDRPVMVSWTEGNDAKVAYLAGTNNPETGTTHSAVSVKIPLEAGLSRRVVIQGTAEDGTQIPVYALTFTRLNKSDNANLKTLSFVTNSDRKEWITDFDPIKFFYEVSLEYGYNGTSKAKVKADPEDFWAKKPDITGPAVHQSLLDMLFNTGTADVDLLYDKNAEDHSTLIAITAKSESGRNVVYQIRVTIQDPNEDNALSLLNVYRTGEAEPLKFENGQVFNKDVREFYLRIPYASDALTFEVQPNEDKAQRVEMTHPQIYAPMLGSNPETVLYKKKGEPIRFLVKVPPSSPVKPEQKDFDYSFRVQAESDDWTETPYVVHITRADPDTNSLLAGMTVAEADTGAAVPGFAFNPQKLTYDFTVPYTTSQVIVSPTAASKLSSITVDGKKITDIYTGKTVDLRMGAVTTVIVEVTPEAGSGYKTVYQLNITRTAPGADARLLSLVVNGGQDMRPNPFVPATLSYSVSIPEGVKNFTITAIPVDSKATLTIDGKAAATGVASAPIVTTQADTTIKIVVTAEDGKTQKTYLVRVRDYNYVKKSSNTNLGMLGFDYGDLKPGFRANIVEYELYVKPTAMSIRFSPETESSRATVQLFEGSREIARHNNIFASSLMADKTDFTFTVTAEDGTKQDYLLHVYRNNAKKQGDLKPITAAMVNYTENPIVIDITQYPIIDATVFNVLKTDYPDKTILFEGNDYTLQIAGKDIAGLVPHTRSYDLRFSFTSPDQSQIEDALWNIDEYNQEPVYVHFDDHGALPGKMLLTVHLGRAYSSKQLFWNYYNAERDRIDYYGYVNASAKGTITIPIDHFSTFFVTTKKLPKAENKVGITSGGMNSDGTGGDVTVTPGGDNMNGGGTQGKPNPATGAPKEKSKE